MTNEAQFIRRKPRYTYFCESCEHVFYDDPVSESEDVPAVRGSASFEDYRALHRTK
jgi:hypothetical protein